jgi:ribose transport system substrate-binding protein
LRKTLIILLILFLFSSCGNNLKQRKLDVAIIGKADDSYWNDVKTGAESAGKVLGVNVHFYVPKKQDPAWQIRKLEEIIGKSIDGVAVAPSDPKSITSIMTNIVQSDVPCLALETDVAKGRHAYIGTGNYYAGQQAGEAMIEILNSIGKIDIVTDTSVPDFLQRVQGFKDAIAEHENVSVDVTLDKPYSYIQPADIGSMLGIDGKTTGKPANPEINSIFCASDSIGLVVAKALKKANKTEQIKIVCIGESVDVMKAVSENLIQVAISRRPYRLGYSCVLVLHNMIKAGINNTLTILPKSEIIDPGVVVLTPSNIDEYREQLIKRGIKVKF